MWKQNTRKKNVYNDNYEQKAAKKIKWKEINCKPEKCVFMCVLYKYVSTPP